MAITTMTTVPRPTAARYAEDGASTSDAALVERSRRGDYFEVVAKSSLASPSGSNPARLDFLLSVTSSQMLGTMAPVPITLLADLDFPITLGSGVAAAQEYYRGTAAALDKAA